MDVDCYELFVPVSRRSDGVMRKVRELLKDNHAGDDQVGEFLKTLLIALKKLDRQ